MTKRLMMALAAGALVAAMVPGVASATALPFTDCGSIGDPVDVTGVDIDPYPLSKGELAKVSVTGESDARFKKVELSYTLEYLGIPLLSGSGRAQIKEGPFSLSAPVNVPTEAPSGSYDLQVVATSQEGEPLLCVAVDFTIG